jgi:hypothetical protein
VPGETRNNGTRRLVLNSIDEGVVHFRVPKDYTLYILVPNGSGAHPTS